MGRGKKSIKDFISYHFNFDIKVWRAALEWNFYLTLVGANFWFCHWSGVGGCMWNVQFHVQFCYQLTFVLEPRKPTENRDLSWDLPYANWLLASSQAFKYENPNSRPYLCCCFVFRIFTDFVSCGYFCMCRDYLCKYIHIYTYSWVFGAWLTNIGRYSSVLWALLLTQLKKNHIPL
jgi:hypothetical protein